MTATALGIGATLVTATTTALAHVQPEEAGVRSGLVSTFHDLGSALGVAVLSSLAATSVTVAGTGAARPHRLHPGLCRPARSPPGPSLWSPRYRPARRSP